MKKNILCLFFAALLSLSTACSSNTKVEYKNDIDLEITQEDLVDEMGGEPSATEEQDNAEQYIYEECEYLGYTGKMTYMFALDSLVVSRWESTTDSKDTMSEMYETIQDELKKTYGEGKETGATEEDMACSWEEEDKTILIGTAMEDSQYKVYMMESKS